MAARKSGAFAGNSAAGNAAGGCVLKAGETKTRQRANPPSAAPAGFFMLFFLGILHKMGYILSHCFFYGLKGDFLWLMKKKKDQFLIQRNQERPFFPLFRERTNKNPFLI
jgi:hypothetical protein